MSKPGVGLELDYGIFDWSPTGVGVFFLINEEVGVYLFKSMKFNE